MLFLRGIMLNIAEKMRFIRKSMGLNQTEMAKKVDLSQRTWSSYETGRSNPPLKVLMKLAEMGYTIPGLTTGSAPAGTSSAGANTFGSPSAFPHVVTDTPQSGSFTIPLLDQKLSAGHGQYLPDTDKPVSYIEAPAYLKRYGKNVVALYVDGDSMEPTLSRGDMVVCDSCGFDGEGIYAIQMDGHGYVKRISRKPGKVVVTSDNPAYENWEEPLESTAFRIVGRVHCVIRKLD